MAEIALSAKGIKSRYRGPLLFTDRDSTFNAVRPLRRMKKVLPFVVKFFPDHYTEEDLYELFALFEPPHYIRILRDSLDKHMNMAFVSYLQDHLPDRFNSDSEAFVMEFIEAFNGRQVIPNQPLLVMLSKKAARTFEVDFTTIYVHGLAPEVDKSLLYAHCSAFGTVEFLRIEKNNFGLHSKDNSLEKGLSMKFAHVRYADERDAISAVDGLRNLTLFGKKLYAFPFMRPNLSADKGPASVVILNFPAEATEPEIHSFVCRHGNVVDFRFLEDKTRRGCVVAFDDLPTARRAAERINGTTFQERQLECKMTISKLEKKKMGQRYSVIQELKDRHERGLYPYGPELYLSNLPSSIEEFQLLRLVQDRIGFRKVRRCKIVYDSHGHSRCYGFLTFYDLEGCISAIRALQNKQVKGKILRLVPSKNPPRARTENTNQIVVRNIRGENSPTHADNQSPPRPLKNSTGSWMHMDQEDASITIMKRETMSELPQVHPGRLCSEDFELIVLAKLRKMLSYLDMSNEKKEESERKLRGKYSVLELENLIRNPDRLYKEVEEIF